MVVATIGPRGVVGVDMHLDTDPPIWHDPPLVNARILSLGRCMCSRRVPVEPLRPGAFPNHSR